MEHISKLRNKRPDGGNSIERSSLVFLDIETTGLYPKRGARISEIAILSRNKELFRWQQNSDLNTDGNLSNKFLKINEYLATGVAVGHNICFDLEFLAYEAERLGFHGPDVLFIDTLGLARNICKPMSDYKLGTILKRFNILVKEPMHTAIVDAKAVRALFWKLVNVGNIETLAHAGMQRLNWTTY